jgi:methylglutaconyl-CoA hydratase
MSAASPTALEIIAALPTVSFSQDDRGVGLLVIDRPPVNALGKQLVQDLGTATAALAADRSVRALALAATGRTFCAGADLKERQSMGMDEVRAFVGKLSTACQDIAELPFPTVAAIHGTAAGGGCELALACDFRVLDESGRIGLPETTLGIVPGAGGTQRLPRLIGNARAKKWIFTGRLFGAAEALADGVVDATVPAGEVRATALEMMAEMARSAPLALHAAKSAVDAAFDGSMAEGLKREWKAYESILETEDRLEALAAFKEKRPPVFKGR